MKKNDYDEIFGDELDNVAGFEFTYGNRHVGRSRPISKAEVEMIDEGNGNSDLLFVRCKSCGEYMEFYKGNTVFDSWWRCPVCGSRVKESTVYTRLEKENIAYLEEMDDE